jgi:hypothetical protein
MLSKQDINVDKYMIKKIIITIFNKKWWYGTSDEKDAFKQDLNVEIQIIKNDKNYNLKWYRTFGKMLVLVFMSAHSAAALAPRWRRQRRWRRRRRKHRRRRNNADVRDPEALVGVAVEVVAVT